MAVQGCTPACVTRVLLGWNVGGMLAVGVPLACVIRYMHAMHFAAIDVAARGPAQRAAQQDVLDKWASAMTSMARADQ